MKINKNKKKEMSSCSNFNYFQARRSNIKISKGGSKHLAHTINGSALAVGRTLVALIENRYEGGDEITLPIALKPYFDSLKISL